MSPGRLLVLVDVLAVVSVRCCCCCFAVALVVVRLANPFVVAVAVGCWFCCVVVRTCPYPCPCGGVAVVVACSRVCRGGGGSGGACICACCHWLLLTIAVVHVAAVPVSLVGVVVVVVVVVWFYINTEFYIKRTSLVSAAEALRRSRACERRKSPESPEHCEVLRSLCEALSSQSSERRLLSWRPEMPKYSDKCMTLTKWRHGYQYCKDPKGLKSLHQAKGQEDGLFSSSRASLCVSASWLKPELAACARSDGRQ